MDDPFAPPDPDTCWECGALANPVCTEWTTLVTPFQRPLSGCGYPVVRGRWAYVVKVPIPRCRACTVRGYVSFALVLGAAMAGTFAVPPLMAALLSPAWLPRPQSGIFYALGFILGMVGAGLAVAWVRVRGGRRSLEAYPPLVRLRGAGWDHPKG